jgi:hypothetical protein
LHQTKVVSLADRESFVQILTGLWALETRTVDKAKIRNRRGGLSVGAVVAVVSLFGSSMIAVANVRFVITLTRVVCEDQSTAFCGSPEARVKNAGTSTAALVLSGSPSVDEAVGKTHSGVLCTSSIDKLKDRVLEGGGRLYRIVW